MPTGKAGPKRTTPVVARPCSFAPSARSRRVAVFEKVRIKIQHSGNFVGTTTIAEQPGTYLPTTILHGHAVADLEMDYGRSEEVYAVVKHVHIVDDCHDEPYSFRMKEPEVPETLQDMYPQEGYIWDLNCCVRLPSEYDTTPAAATSDSGASTFGAKNCVSDNPRVAESGDSDDGESGDDLFEIPNSFDKTLYVTREKEVRIDQLMLRQQSVASWYYSLVTDWCLL